MFCKSFRYVSIVRLKGPAQYEYGCHESQRVRSALGKGRVPITPYRIKGVTDVQLCLRSVQSQAICMIYVYMHTRHRAFLYT